MVGVEERSLLVVRAKARGPQWALMATCASLSLVGLNSLLAKEPAPATRKVLPSRQIDFAAQAAAQASAQRLVGGTASRVIGDEARGGGRRLITVGVTAPVNAAVAVLVERDAQGALVVDDPPALVGAPVVRHREMVDGFREVTDPPLVRVVRRVLRNYLTGEADDVAADVLPGARVSLPSLPLQPRPVDSITWLRPGQRVVAELSARLPSGDLVPLRYELGVRRLGARWLVTQVHVDPLHQEVLP